MKNTNQQPLNGNRPALLIRVETIIRLKWIKFSGNMVLVEIIYVFLCLYGKEHVPRVVTNLKLVVILCQRMHRPRKKKYLCLRGNTTLPLTDETWGAACIKGLIWPLWSQTLKKFHQFLLIGLLEEQTNCRSLASVAMVTKKADKIGLK